MDRHQFIAQLFLMFPRSFTEENTATWRRAYEDILPITTDFDSLMQTVISEYAANSIPKPAWFKDKAEVIEATRHEREKFQRENPTLTRSIYAEINGRTYEFGYNTMTETKEQAIRGVYARFPNANITIKEKSEVFNSGGFNNVDAQNEYANFSKANFNAI